MTVPDWAMKLINKPPRHQGTAAKAEPKLTAEGLRGCPHCGKLDDVELAKFSDTEWTVFYSCCQQPTRTAAEAIERFNRRC
jgi:hypothetical protein